MTNIDTDERRLEQRPETGEAPFFPGEVFYSRTDARGVIKSANYVFRRIAQYDWDDLIGAPHKLIRHPDMPKGIFYILWQSILNGETNGGYVKNLASDGLHYWVFAVMTPCKDGFLSARMKPTSDRLRQVEELYANARRKEVEEDISAEDSAQFILQDLARLGFATYGDFVSDCLSDELQSERSFLGLPANERILHSQAMLSTVHALTKQADDLMHDFEALTSVPRNLQIKAKDIEPSGGPLTALSTDYGRMSQEMTTWFLQNVVGENNNFVMISKSVKDALLFYSALEILRRCQQQLLDEERSLGDTSIDQECERLEAVITHFLENASHASQNVALEAERLTKACKEMRRTLMGLNTVRVTGKIENARLPEDSANLGEIISQLGVSQKKVENHVERVANFVEEISKGVRATQSSRDTPIPIQRARAQTAAVFEHTRGVA